MITNATLVDELVTRACILVSHDMKPVTRTGTVQRVYKHLRAKEGHKTTGAMTRARANLCLEMFEASWVKTSKYSPTEKKVLALTRPDPDEP